MLYCLKVLLSSAKLLNDFGWSTVFIERLHIQDFRVFQISEPFVSIFIKQGFKYRTRFFAVLGKIVSSLYVLCTFAPGQRLLTVGYMSDQIKRIEILTHFFCQGVQQYPFILEFVHNSLFPIGTCPLPQKIIK